MTDIHEFFCTKVTPKIFCLKDFFSWFVLASENVLFLFYFNLFHAEIKNSSENLQMCCGSLTKEIAVHKNNKIEKKSIFPFPFKCIECYINERIKELSHCKIWIGLLQNKVKKIKINEVKINQVAKTLFTKFFKHVLVVSIVLKFHFMKIHPEMRNLLGVHATMLHPVHVYTCACALFQKQWIVDRCFDWQVKFWTWNFLRLVDCRSSL